MKTPEGEYPLNAWFLSHQELRGKELWRKMEVLSSCSFTVGLAVRIEETWEKSRQSDGSIPIPDLVECVSLYGYARLLIQDWDEFPIEVLPADVELWREWGLGASLFEFRERNIAGVAGGFLELAGKDPSFAASTLHRQLNEKYAELAEFVNKPLQAYRLREYTEEQLDDFEEVSADHSLLDKPFRLYEELLCFSYGFPDLRMFSITEESAELGMPSLELYNALEAVDINFLLKQLDDNEGKLRTIRRYLAEQNHSINIPTAPETFWWRHWKSGTSKRR